MPYSALKRKLQEVREPSTEFWKCFEEKLYQRKYTHNDIWLNEGNIGKKIALLVEGGAISYRKKENQKQISKLWLPNDFILSPSVFTHTRSEHTIEFRGECHIIQFSIAAINQLRKTFDEALFYIDYFLGMEMRTYDEHSLWLKSFTSHKRHIDSIKKYGKIYLDLTNSEKGSYLGVTEKRIRDIL
jgi:CRP-like cAMP-binding protein